MRKINKGQWIEVNCKYIRSDKSVSFVEFFVKEFGDEYNQLLLMSSEPNREQVSYCWEMLVDHNASYTPIPKPYYGPVVKYPSSFVN